MVASPKRFTPGNFSKLSVATPLRKRKDPRSVVGQFLKHAPEVPYIFQDSKKRTSFSILAKSARSWDNQFTCMDIKRSSNTSLSSTTAILRPDLGSSGAYSPWRTRVTRNSSSLASTYVEVEQRQASSRSDGALVLHKGYTNLRQSQLSAVPRELHAPITWREREARARESAQEQKRQYMSNRQQNAENVSNRFQEWGALPADDRMQRGQHLSTTPTLGEEAMQVALEKLALEKKEQEFEAKLAIVSDKLRKEKQKEVKELEAKLAMNDRMWKEKLDAIESRTAKLEAENKLRDQDLEKYKEQVREAALGFRTIKQGGASAGVAKSPVQPEHQQKSVQNFDKISRDLASSTKELEISTSTLLSLDDHDFARREAERKERMKMLNDRKQTQREQVQEWRKSSRIYAVPPVPAPEEKDPALEPLSEEAEAAVTSALGAGKKNEILAMHEKENIEITRGVMSCLKDVEWLNDEVINIYLALLKERELASPGKFLKCHFFNTFFFNKLYNDGKEYCYNNVRRWTTPKKVNYLLHECDKIIIPIHLQMHWVLGVINIRDQRIEFFDSLGPNYSRDIVDIIFSSLAQYIEDEAMNKAGVTLNPSNWEFVNHADTPRQNNGSDCGMFMLKFADYHSRDQPFNFGPKDIHYFRRRIVWEILQLKAT